MPITNGSITVGTAATLITTCGVNPGTLHISNIDNTDTIFVGGATVAVNAGHALPKSASEDFVMYAGQQMFAVSSKSGHAIAFVLVTP
jgi:2-keto-3-deoxy-L-rhamnonate aldolase RhmA